MTDYTYATGWLASPQSSASFHDPAAHQNPTSWPFTRASFAPASLGFGNFTLPAALQASLPANTPVPVPDPSALCAEQHRRRRLLLSPPRPAPQPPPTPPIPPHLAPPPTVASCPWTAAGGVLYYSSAPGNAPATSPRVGDIRLSWTQNADTSASVIAKQVLPSSGTVRTFSSYTAKSGHTCFLLEEGVVGAPEMIARAKARNAALTWFLRILGILLNWAALSAIVHPLCVAIDLFPFAGPIISDLVAVGQSFVSAIASFVICFFVIAVSWLAVRPLIGVPLLLLAVVGIGALVQLVRRQRAKRSAARGYGLVDNGASGGYGGGGMQMQPQMQPQQPYMQPGVSGAPYYGGVQQPPPHAFVQQPGFQPQPQFAGPSGGMGMGGLPPPQQAYGAHPAGGWLQSTPPPFFAAQLPPPRAPEVSGTAMGYPGPNAANGAQHYE